MCDLFKELDGMDPSLSLACLMGSHGETAMPFRELNGLSRRSNQLQNRTIPTMTWYTLGPPDAGEGSLEAPSLFGRRFHQLHSCDGRVVWHPHRSQVGQTTCSGRG